jgi:hypothetical protein
VVIHKTRRIAVNIAKLPELLGAGDPAALIAAQ